MIVYWTSHWFYCARERQISNIVHTIIALFPNGDSTHIWSFFISIVQFCMQKKGTFLYPWVVFTFYLCFCLFAFCFLRDNMLTSSFYLLSFKSGKLHFADMFRNYHWHSFGKTVQNILNERNIQSVPVCLSLPLRVLPVENCTVKKKTIRNCQSRPVFL